MRLLLALAAAEDMLVHQMDAVTAFLNADVDTDVFIKPPVGYSYTGDKVLKLKKSVYGIKTAPRNWHLLIDRVLTEELSMTNCLSDLCVFRRHNEQGSLLTALYVDDLIICGSDLTIVNEAKTKLGQRFQMKDLGELNWC